MTSGAALAVTLFTATIAPAGATVTKTLISTDITTVVGAQHHTEVEPVTATWGNTIVSTFQEGRYASAASGAAAAGFATSTDAGATWTSGLLPGITTNSPTPNIYPRTVNMEVAYDAAHATWLITNHAEQWNGTAWFYAALLVSHSSDGLTWSLPVDAAPGANTATVRPDKGWIVCDNNAGSQHYGRCYIVYISQALNKRFQMVYSDDAGETWSAPIGTATKAVGYDPIPVVRPDGSVVVIATQAGLTKIVAFQSTDGGASWTDPIAIATLQLHTLAANLRTRSKPAPAVDAAGRVYVTWYDCRFRTACTNNDIVLSTSDDGITWTAPSRVNVDATTSTVEHFVAGIGVAPGTSGVSAQLNLVFYEMANAACTSATCLIYAVTTSSTDGGVTWAAVTKLHTTAMKPYMLASSTLGLMLADYHTVGYVNNVPWAAVVIAGAKVGTTYNENIYGARLA